MSEKKKFCVYFPVGIIEKKGVQMKKKICFLEYFINILRSQRN